MPELIDLDSDLEEAGLSLEDALAHCESLVHDLNVGRAGPPEATDEIEAAQTRIEAVRTEIAHIREALRARVQFEQVVQKEIASWEP